MRIIICSLVFILPIIVAGQTISIDNAHFSTGTYGAGGSITVPVKLQGCFGQNEKFDLYLSDASGNFPGKLIGGYNSFFTPFINGVLPVGTSGSAYKLMVKARFSGASAVTNAFKVSGSSETIFNLITDADYKRNDSTYGICPTLSSPDSIEIAFQDSKGKVTSIQILDSTGKIISSKASGSNTFSFQAQKNNYYTLQAFIKDNATNIVSARSFLVLFSSTNAGIQTSGKIEICLPESAAFSVNYQSEGGIQYNYPSTLYTANWGDKSNVTTLTQCNLVNQKGKLIHQYDTTSCGQPDIDTTHNAFLVQIDATNDFCPANFLGTKSTTKVFEKPNAVIEGYSSNCASDTFTLCGYSSYPGNAAPNNAVSCGTTPLKYKWYINGSLISASSDSCFTTVFPPGNNKVRLVVNNGVCEDDTTVTFCLDPKPKPDFKVNGADSIAGCAPKDVIITNTSNKNVCGTTVYHWFVTDSNGVYISPGVVYTISPNDSAFEPKFRFIEANKYYIHLYFLNSCTGPYIYDTVKIVNLFGTANAQLPADQKYCGLKTIDFGKDANHLVKYNTNQPTDTYSWKISGGSFTYTGGTDSTSRYPKVIFNEYKKYTVEIDFQNGCGKTTDQQLISFEEAIVALAGNDTTICYSTNTLQLNGNYSGIVDSIKWKTSGTGTFNDIKIKNPLYTFSTPDKNAGGTKLILSLFPPKTSVCPVTNDTLTVTIKPRNFAADTTINICSGSAVNFQPVSSINPSTYAWTSSVITGTATGNTASGSGKINDLLTNTSQTNAATVKYVITPTADNCKGDPFNAIVNVNVKPGVILKLPKDTICSGENINLLVTGTLKAMGFTYTSQVQGTVTGNSSQPQIVHADTIYITDKPINNSSSNATVTYIIQSYGIEPSDCIGQKDTIKVVVRPGVNIAAAGNDILLCNANTITLNGNIPQAGTGAWKQITTEPVTITNPLLNNTTVTGLAGDKIYTFEWRISGVSGCGASTDTVAVFNRPLITPANAGNDTVICNYVQGANLSMPLKANSNTSRPYEQGKWSIVSQPPGSNAVFADAQLPATTFTVNEPGTYILEWQISNDGGCTPSKDSVVIKVFSSLSPGIINAGNQNVCSGENVTVTLSQYTGTIEKWQYKLPYDAASWKDTLVTNPSISFNSLSDTILIRAVIVSAGAVDGCPQLVYSDSILIDVAPPTKTGNTNNDDTVCSGANNGTITLTNYIGNIVKWQSSEDGNKWTDITNTANTQSYNNLTKTTYYRAVVQSGSCNNGYSDTTIITVAGAITNADAGDDLSLCNATTAILNASSPAFNETGTWKLISGNSVTFSSLNNPSAIVSGLTPGTYQFEWSITNNICPATKDTINISVYPPLINTIPGTSITICSGVPVIILGNTVSGGTTAYTYQWQESMNGGLVWNDIIGATGADLSYLPSFGVLVRRVVYSGPCTSESNTAAINVQPPITNNSISANQEICVNTTAAIITGTIPAGANGTYQYSWQQSTDGNLWTTIPNATGKDYDPGKPLVTTYYRRNVSTDLCNGPQSSASNIDTITVHNNAIAAFTYQKNKDCPPFMLDASIITATASPETNGIYNWYANNQLIGTGITFPGYTISNPGDSVSIKLVVISSHGCLPDSMETKFYTVERPVTSFNVNDSVGCGPISILFTNTTPNAAKFNFYWNFGNGITSSAQDPGTIVFQPSPYYTDTIYKVTLSSYTDCDTIVYTRNILVKSKPKALFTPVRSTGCSPFTAEFNNTSRGDRTTYVWDFGDGGTLTTGSDSNVHHTFYTGIQDTFAVKLIAINECGNDTIQYAIVVSPNLVKLDFAVNGNEISGCSPHLVRFINNTSGATSFNWDFGDGNVLTTYKNIDTVTHLYEKPGTYNVVLLGSNGCSDTTGYETITVFKTPSVNFSSAPLQLCIGDTVQFTNQSDSLTSLLWNFGDGYTSVIANPLHSYNSAGVYNVKLTGTVQYGIGNACSDTSTQIITVVAALPGSFAVSDSVGSCLPFSVTFTNLSIPSVKTVWDFGDGAVDTGDIVTHTYITSGNYTVKMNALDPGGCTYESAKTIVVLGPEGTFTYDKGFVCNATPVRFEATVVNVDSIRWHFGDGETAVTTNNIIYHTYTQSGYYLPYAELLAGSGTDACTVQLLGIDTIKVDYLNAGFTFSDAKECGITHVAFTDTSRVFFGIKNWSWKLGDGATSTQQNPQHNYTVTNNWPIELIITSNSGCTDTVNQPVYIKVNSIPVAAIMADNNNCTNHDVLFSAVVQSEDSVTLYKWIFSNGVTAETKSVNVVFSTPGTYTATLITGTAQGCYDTAKHTITILQSPVVKTTDDVLICRGQTIQLNTEGAIAYQWAPVSDVLSCTTCASPLAAPLVSTLFYVTGKAANGCTATDSVLITVAQPFDISITGRDSICIGESSRLFVSGASNYTWSPATGIDDIHSPSPLFNPTVTTYYTVIGKDNYNCFSDTAHVSFGVGNYPTISLGPDQVLATGTKLPLVSAVTNGPITNWIWNPTQDLSCSNCALPVATIKKDVCYTVTAANAYGCSASDTMCIQVFCESGQVFIPNAFTPDGDGRNDKFMIRGTGIKSVRSLRIFNRWGQVVFERANFAPNDPAYAWDGTIKGAAAPPEVYVYTCEVYCENDVPYTYKGNVAILK